MVSFAQCYETLRVLCVNEYLSGVLNSDDVVFRGMQNKKRLLQMAQCVVEFAFGNVFQKARSNLDAAPAELYFGDTFLFDLFNLKKKVFSLPYS